MNEKHLKTGFLQLNLKLKNMLLPGTLSVLSGFIGSGKSTLLYNLGKNIVFNERRPILWVETEGSLVRVRLAALLSNLPYGKIIQGKLTDIEEELLMSKDREIDEAPFKLISIDDNPWTLDATFFEIYKILTNMDGALLIVDSSSSLKGKRSVCNNKIKITTSIIMRTLKWLATTTNSAVIAAFSYGRGFSERSANTVPELTHFSKKNVLPFINNHILLHQPSFFKTSPKPKNNEEEIHLYVDYDPVHPPKFADRVTLYSDFHQGIFFTERELI